MPLPVSRRLDFTEIPVVDLAPLMNGQDSAATITAISRACRDIGFVYVKNHGVDFALIDAMIKEAASYFARPMEEKKRTLLDPRLRGYLPLYYRSYEGEANAATSHQEGFWIGHPRPLSQENRLDGPNLWPEESEGLRRAMEAYFVAAEGLAKVMMRAFSLALELPTGFFAKRFERPQTLLKINHYPPQDNPESVSNIGVVPHSDSGAFTILWQDDNGGLEIQSKSGEWVGAPPIEGTFVINLGNVMQIWTNGAFSSTPHRVVNRSGVDRYSIPLFVNPRWDVPVEPLIGEAPEDFESELYESYQCNVWRRTFPIAGID